MNRRKPTHVTLTLGPMPVAAVNSVLQLELEEGLVVLTPGVQVHAWRRHTADYDVLLPHIAAVATNPLLIGDDLKNPGYIELIGRVPSVEGYILVAVCIEPNGLGQYEVRSFYTTNADKVQRRKERGFLKNAP